MYIDDLTLMLVNVTAGLVMPALWVFSDSFRPEQKRWVTGFLMTGLMGAATELNMMFAWPLPGAFNIVFGDWESTNQPPNPQYRRNNTPGIPGHRHRPVVGECRDPRPSQLHPSGDLP